MKRIVFFIFFTCLVSIVVFDVSYLFHGLRCTYFRGYKSAQIDDHRFFYTRNVESDSSIVIPFSKDYNKKGEGLDSLIAVLNQSKSVAFLIVKDDSLRFEKYWGSGSESSATNSFSIAKSITSLLVGCAIRDGYIDGVEQDVVDFIPEIKQPENFEPVKIKHLLEMSSGLNWLENYKRPISVTAKAYYGTNLQNLTLNQKFINPPGLAYKYQSGNTQILGILLERAVGENVSSYAGRSLWSKIGAENDALWTLDYNGGIEKVFCCFNSNARDFAKIGLLMLNRGKVGGRVVIEEEYVDWLLSKPKLMDADDRFGRLGTVVDYYSNSWWVGRVLEKDIFYARGFLGQYIVIVPEINVVFVRLGKKENEKSTRKNEYMMSDNLKFFTEQVIKNYSF
ncbi:MAG: serine hydrolase [Flavobacteriales bacterium]|nr:serine hydrolase [Flavobacteriales bacterium]|tara:strand:+ start:2458 stop:3639 length:1182 start_codon:yes stop_codon:yes gene_type:complete